jgi:hypothetical protein
MGDHTYKIEVIAYSGYKANERPLFFHYMNRKIKVERIVKKWVGEDKDFFRLIAEDGKEYTISWVRNEDVWLVEKD